MLSEKQECDKYDLSSVRFLYTGAAPTGKETVEELLRRYPTWHVGQGYGMIKHPPHFPWEREEREAQTTESLQV